MLEIARSTNYPPEAFRFVQRGLEYAVREIHGEEEEGQDPKSRHVTGQQLCEGLRDFAVEEYGLLARTVLRSLRIRSTEDFGHIVFAMVDAGLMQTTDDDTIEDFREVYDFAEAFRQTLVLPAR